MWLTNIRRRKKNGLLDRGRIRQLDKLGVVWEPRDQKWEDKFAELVQCRARFGNCNVPAVWPENPRLAAWMHTQRTCRRLNSLTQDRLERLDQIGFSWTPAEEAWESKFAALVEYRRVHGDCLVPTLSKGHARLSNWVRGMRTYRKQGKLSQERIRRLTQLGFVWDGALEAKMEEFSEGVWESKYAALVEYRRAHGHCRVPGRSKDHASLGRWVLRMRSYRRQGKLSQERIRRLTQLGFVWDAFEEQWERMFAALVEYKKAHGDCNLPASWPPNSRLAAWVNTQRSYNTKGKLRPERKKQLGALGFQFSSQGTAGQGEEKSRQGFRGTPSIPSIVAARRRKSYTLPIGGLKLTPAE